MTWCSVLHYSNGLLNELFNVLVTPDCTFLFLLLLLVPSRVRVAPWMSSAVTAGLRWPIFYRLEGQKVQRVNLKRSDLEWRHASNPQTMFFFLLFFLLVIRSSSLKNLFHWVLCIFCFACHVFSMWNFRHATSECLAHNTNGSCWAAVDTARHCLSLVLDLWEQITRSCAGSGFVLSTTRWENVLDLLWFKEIPCWSLGEWWRLLTFYTLIGKGDHYWSTQSVLR